MSGYFNATLTTVLDDGEEIDTMCEVDTNTQMIIYIEELAYMGDEEDMEDIESRVKREYVTLDENNAEYDACSLHKAYNPKTGKYEKKPNTFYYE